MTGPPKEVEAGAPNHQDGRPTTTNRFNGHHTADTRGHFTDWLSQLRRRRSATRRLAPLDCGCPDPWPCRCTEPPLSEHALDGWRDAALTVLFNGQVPLLPIEVRRALYRRGGPDRVLAERLHEACGGEAA